MVSFYMTLHVVMLHYNVIVNCYSEIPSLLCYMVI